MGGDSIGPNLFNRSLKCRSRADGGSMSLDFGGREGRGDPVARCGNGGGPSLSDSSHSW
jgi:hypothetical protein